VQRLRAPFLVDLSASEAGRGSNSTAGRARGGVARGEGRALVISHEMSRGYVLEYPIDDPDEDDEDDFDEDDEGDEDDDEDDDEVETWQVSGRRSFR
jgi:hypothetical protein